jgi:hypothetical protein
VKKIIGQKPIRATMLSGAFPGFGQIYNRKYWKIPLVYAGFVGFGYAIVFNSKNYNTFIKAYQDFTDKIPQTDSYLAIIIGDPKTYDRVLYPNSYNPSTASNVKDQLLLKVDYFKKYRDLSYIGIVAWYIISILDANVDASLFDYEVNDNLNITLAPVPVQVPLYSFTGIGINLSLKINF